jgi:putative ABC transport system permease protein
MHPRRQAWQVALAVSVAISVAFSVILTSVAFGVHDEITDNLSNPAVRQSGLIDVDRITTILVLLTVVVTCGMLAQTAAATFVFGVTSMRVRREEIALRRQSGVLRSTLLKEFLLTVLQACLLGGIIGEGVGVLAGVLLHTVTVLPVSFTLVSVVGAFPVTVCLAVAATLAPAWRAAGASPALLRKEA